MLGSLTFVCHAILLPLTFLPQILNPSPEAPLSPPGHENGSHLDLHDGFLLGGRRETNVKLPLHEMYRQLYRRGRDGDSLAYGRETRGRKKVRSAKPSASIWLQIPLVVIAHTTTVCTNRKSRVPSAPRYVTYLSRKHATTQYML